MKHIKIGIAGGAGMTGGELLRILVNHPHADIRMVHSRSHAGQPVWVAHPDLYGDTDLQFTGEFEADLDVLFLCLGHGESRKFLQANPVPAHTAIIDLSQDFRLEGGLLEGHDSHFEGREFVYGLPERYREQLLQARNVANPGCFATALQLALLPAAAEGLLQADIHVSATTGSTGAGQKLQATTAFSWRNNNVSTYKAFEHQHLHEIGQTLRHTQAGFDAPIHFLPYRGNFSRGILASVYFPCPQLSEQQARELYAAYYASHPFTHVLPHDLDLKQVVNTNKCFVQVEKKGELLLVTSAIDNLLKGASGQAVQNMNLLTGLPEDCGLKLKAPAF